MNTWSKNLIFLREQNGVTQSELASTLNLSRSTYANYETGVNLPNLETIQKILRHFGVTFEDFLFQNLSDVLDKKKFGQNIIEKIVRNDVRHNVRDKPKDPETWWSFLQSQEYLENIAPVYDLGDDAGAEIRYFIKKNEKLKYLAFLNLPDLGKGIHFRIKITTDNMYPVIKPNDNIVITYLPGSACTLNDNDIIITLDKDDNISCNRLFKINDDSYKFSSDEKKYKSFNRSLKDFTAVFKLREIHTRYFEL